MSENDIQPFDVYQLYKGWKEDYLEVFVLHIEGIDFYFRLITRQEYETLKQVETNNLKIDEMVAELCVLEPLVDDWQDSIYAGYTSTLAHAILEESLIIPRQGAGENYLEDLVENEYNRVSGSFELQMPAIIIRAFPAYKLEEVESWPISRQVKYYARAIYILNNIENYGIEFVEDE